MTLNTAQYLAPLNSQQVLSGYAQGVVEGVGISIQPNGTITLNPTTASSLGFLVSATTPAPVLSWPAVAGSAGSTLIDDGSGNLSWSTGYTPVVPAGQPFPHTGASVLPAGITSARPAGAQRGYIRYNTDYEYLEWYNGIGWLPVTPPSGNISSFISVTTPTATSPGDFWYDQNVDLEKVWTGVAWVPTAPLATTSLPGLVTAGSNVQLNSPGVLSVDSVIGVPGGVSNVGVTSVADNTNSFSSDRALSANQGRLLQAQIRAVAIKNLDDISINFDSIRKTFNLAIGGTSYTPNPTSNIVVFLDGIAQAPGVGNDYTILGSTITFTVAPPSGTLFYAFTVTL